MSNLNLTDISFGYNAESNVIEKINLTLEKGMIGSILGKSGSGKSSLLRCIAGLEKINSGKIIFTDEKEIIDITELSPHQRRIGFMFQSLALFPNMTVKQNIEFGLFEKTKFEKNTIIDSMLNLIRMTEFADKFPHQLSGGEKQRVALARSLAPSPRLLLMDEPFSGLDPDLKEEVKSDLLSILKNQKTTVLMVTHDRNEAYFFSDYIGLIADKSLKFWKPKSEVFVLKNESVPQLIF